MPDREKYKSTQRHNRSILDTGMPVWAPKKCAKKFHSFKKRISLVIVLKIFLSALGALQQKLLISLRQSSINCDQKHFSATY